MSVIERTVSGKLLWCVVHAHPQKPGSSTDKPPGSIIKCFPHTTEGHERALAMHRAIMAQETRKSEPTAVLRVTAPAGAMLINGDASHYLYPQKYKRHIGEPVFVGENGRILGIARLAEPVALKSDQIEAAGKKHGLDAGEVRKRWGNAKKLWLYPVTVLEKYERPVEYAETKNTSWIENPVIRKKTGEAAVLCFHHDDLDGIASAAIVARAHPGAELVSVGYEGKFPWDSLKGREIVYMVDFALQPFAEMIKLKQQLEGQGARFVWIDHHQTALDSAKDIEFQADGLCQVGKAGCELTWGFLNPKQKMPEVVKFAGRFDVWDHSDSRTLPIHYAMEANKEANDPNSTWWKRQLNGKDTDISGMVTDGKAIEQWLTEFNKRHMERASFDINFEGLRCVAAPTTLPGSMQFDSVKKGKDAAIAFRPLSDGKWTVSMYSLKAGVNVGEVCASQGGGGHPGAAGFQCDELPFKASEAPEGKPVEKAEAQGFEFEEGASGTGVIQTHEIGPAGQFVMNADPCGWTPMELDPSQLDWIAGLADVDVGEVFKAYAAAQEGEGEALEEIIIAGAQRKLGEVERNLLGVAKPINVHSDIRMVEKDQSFWQGGEIATPGNQFAVNALKALGGEGLEINTTSPDGNEVVRGPAEWMEVGVSKTEIFPPGAPGATENEAARFRVREQFEWQAGAQESDFKEFKFTGEIFNGRYILKNQEGSWVLTRPIDQEYISEMLRDSGEEVEWNAQIIKRSVSDEKRTVTSVVLKPGTTDAQGDKITDPEVIENAAENYLIKMFAGKAKLGYLHEDFSRPFVIVQSYIAPQPLIINGKNVPAGAWILKVKVFDNEVWLKIKAGEIRGFSIGGRARVRRVAA